MLDKPQVLHKEMFTGSLITLSMLVVQSGFEPFLLLDLQRDASCFCPKPPYTKDTAGGALPPSIPSPS